MGGWPSRGKEEVPIRGGGRAGFWDEGVPSEGEEGGPSRERGRGSLGGGRGGWRGAGGGGASVKGGEGVYSLSDCDRSLETIDPLFPTSTMPGRNTSGFYCPSRHLDCLHHTRSVVRCPAIRMKGELHSKNRL